jgi:hypothetical protein
LAGFFAAFLAAFFLTGIQYPSFQTAVAGLDVAVFATHKCVGMSRVQMRQRIFVKFSKFFFT